MNNIHFESISIEVTKRCNLYCSFCYAEASNKQDMKELSMEQMRSFLGRFRSHGGRRVLFTGGEVLLRNDIYDIIACAKSQGLMVDVFSNGTLMTAQSAIYLAEHADLIFISIDGTDYVHDSLRGVCGSFEGAIHAAEMLHNAGARFAIQCMIVPDNIDKMDWLIRFARRTEPVIIKLGNVSRTGRGRHQNKLWLNEKQLVYLKTLAGEISEKCNNFHTRVVTNIITAQELKAFYPDFKYILQPWMLPDGRILSCYVCHSIPFWTFSTAEAYPLPLVRAVERRERLASLAHAHASGLPHFDFMELVSCVAEDIAGIPEQLDKR
jgi:MoaA/NifB/PqqE/SkfB family radical SAM enzyme